jgi:6-pyruvoyl-tetrahydropterin synthase related domain
MIPFFWLGIPSGHDFEFHFNSWLEVVQHWKEGSLYPHWAAMAHYGYGEARFIFYPPLSWLLGGLLGLILPWKLVSPADIWITLTLSGISMFLLARRWFSRKDALIAAIAYALNPYHIVIIYWRSAMAELLASALLPLLLLFVLEFEEERPRKIIAALGLVLAAAWLTDVPVAIIMNYSLAALVVCVAVLRRSWKILLYAAAAVVLSAAIASVYVLPVLHQQKWVSINQVLAPGVSPADNFLFTITNDPDHNTFNHLVSVAATWNIAVVWGLLAVSWRSRKQLIWRLLFAWAALTTALMLRFTLPLWDHLPELRYVQLPWRWLLCLNVVFAIALVIAARRWWARVLIYLIAIASVVYVWHRVLPPWWDNSGDIQELVDNQQDQIGNEGTDEYVPVGVDPYDVDQKAPQVRYDGAGSAKIQVQTWNSEKRIIVANATAPGRLILRLFNYRLWNAEVNGHSIKTETVTHTGQMIVPIKRGENRVQVTFVEGWDRWLGAAISVIGVAIAFTLVFWSRRELKGDG